MIAALQRVLRAPGLVLSLALIQLAVAAMAGTLVQSAVAATIGRFAVAADGHLMYSMMSLFVDHPGVPAAARGLLAGSALLALALWTLLAAGIIHRLDRPATASEVVAAGVRGLPAMIVVTLWQLLPRLILIAIVGTGSAKILAFDTWGWLGLLPLLAVLGYVTCALDLARCDVVLHDARRFHVKTALGGFVQAFRRPGVLLRSMVFNTCQWGCAAAILVVSISGWGSGYAIWAARALAVLGMVFGLARVAVAVAAGPAPKAPARPARAEDPPTVDEEPAAPLPETAAILPTGTPLPPLPEPSSQDEDPPQQVPPEQQL